MVDVFTPVTVDVAAFVLARMVGVVMIGVVVEIEREVVGTMVVVGSPVVVALVVVGAG